MLPISVADIKMAAQRLDGQAVRTPLIENHFLNERLGGRLFFKLEPLQQVGSFKIRGAYNRLAQLDAGERARGVVAFSSGNHGQGVAKAGAMLGIAVTILMPETAPKMKIDNCRAYGATVQLYDRFTEDREELAAKIAASSGATIVPSYNDVHIMAGQGTVGLEIAEEMQRLELTPDLGVINCGGGGLSSGSFLALRAYFPKLEAYIAEPEGYAETGLSLEKGERCYVSDKRPSLCDALLPDAPGPLPFEILKALDVKGLMVTDDDALRAVRELALSVKVVGEPGGVASFASILGGKVSIKNKIAFCVISGGNIDPEILMRALQMA